MSNPNRPGLCALPPVPIINDERLNMTVLWRVAGVIAKSPKMHGRRMAVKGGTALAIGHGLPRPSTDLDINLTKQVDLVSIVENVLGKDRRIEVERLDRKQRGHGYTRIVYRHDAQENTDPLTTKIDDMICDGRDDHPASIDAHEVGLCEGVPVYRIEYLAPMKARTLAGPGRTRMQARDLYDVAWLMHHHAEHLPPSQKKRLLEEMNEHESSESKQAEWRQRFDDDEIMSRSDYDDCLLALISALETDPVAATMLSPGIEVRVEESARGHAVMVGDNLYDTFDSDEAARRHLRSMGMEDPAGSAEDHPNAGIATQWSSPFAWHPEGLAAA